MPLKKGSSQATISQNIREFHTGKTYSATKAKFGKAKADKQAIAVAMSTARKYGKAAGGPNLNRFNMENMIMRGSSIRMAREGMINSSIPGRTDKLPMNVKSGSYILPADIPSALGQGNTMAGGDILKRMFSSGPYGMPTMKGRSGSGFPRSRMRQNGGEAGGEEDDRHIPIIAAGGEYIIHPDVVRDLGHGDLKVGHKVLDRFVLNVRKENIKTLKKLPGPKQ